MDTEVNFKDVKLFKAISSNSLNDFNQFVNEETDPSFFRLLNSSGESYLHLAIKSRCDLDIVNTLLPKVRIGQRDFQGQTALDLALQQEVQRSSAVAKAHRDFILLCLKDGMHEPLEELVEDGWQFWPSKGIPELEEFNEARGYLESNMGHVSLEKICNIKSKQDLQMMIGFAIIEESGNMVMERDLLGQMLLHKAVLYRDLQSVTKLISHNKVKDFMLAQDNMGRTPLHYLSCFSKSSEIRLLMAQHVADMESAEELYSVRDNTGYSVNDYIDQKSKIATAKVLHLSKYLGKLDEIDRIFFIIFHKLEVVTDLQLMKNDFIQDFHTKNCTGKAMTDITGRNLLHKMIIYDDVLNVTERVIFTKLIEDKDLAFLQGQDIWGRTPLHYAKLFNREWMFSAIHNPKLCSRELKQQLEEIKDFDGKRPADYAELEEDERERVAKNLRTTISFVHKARVARRAQWKLLHLAAYGYSISRDLENVLEEELRILRCVNSVRMILNMKDSLGNTLIHYAVRLKDMKLLNFITKVTPNDWWMKLTDNMGRTALHYISCLPDTNTIKKNFSGYIDRFPIKDVTGKTPADYTAGDSTVLGHEELRKALCESLGLQRPATFVKHLPTKTVKTVEKDQGLKKYQENNTTSKDIVASTDAKVSSPITEPSGNGPPFNCEYLKDSLGDCLTQGITMVLMQQPKDPIEFLAQYLFKYAENSKYQVC